jgi:hypothetical protein
MLLTLTANALKSRLATSKKGRTDGAMLQVTDLPKFAREELGLFGLTLSTNLLVGADVHRLDAIRDAADKASCPCLVLTESEVQPFGTTNDAAGDAAIVRAQKVVQAASRLGCNSIGLSISGEDSEDGYDFAIERLRRVLQVAERLEVNILLIPHTGMTSDPERVTDLIKKVGGFRVGTFPDFLTASKTADPLQYLKRLTPYASAVTATIVGFKKDRHDPYDIWQYAKVVQAVGYTGTLGLDYRGDGDPVENLRQAKTVLESLVAPPALGEGEEGDAELLAEPLDDDADEADEVDDEGDE